MIYIDCLDLLAQELGFVLKSKQREALEMLLRGKDVFCVLPTALFIRCICLFMQRVLQVPCNGRLSMLSPLCRGIGRKHTTFTSCQNNCFLCRVDYALEENLFDWANVNFGRLLNIFHTERS